MKKLWHDEAWEDYVYWQTQENRSLYRVTCQVFGACALMRKTELSFELKTNHWRLRNAVLTMETSKKAIQWHL